MERTMVSWNVPNFVTINLMACLGFLVFAILTQAIAKRKRGTPSTSGAGEIAAPSFEPAY